MNNQISDQKDIIIETEKNAMKNLCNDIGKRSGIYKIINKVNGKYYVGSSKNINGGARSRWNEGHIKKLNRNIHRNDHLQRAWNKYGKDAFEFSIVEDVIPDMKSLLDTEQKYLTIAKNEQDKCYNLKFNVYGGGELSDYSRKKMSDYAKGRKFSEETKQKMSIASKQRILTPEIRAKYAHRKGMTGISEYQRLKIVEANKRRKKVIMSICTCP